MTDKPVAGPIQKWTIRAMGSIFNFQAKITETQKDSLSKSTSIALEEMEQSWSRFRDSSELSILNEYSLLENPSKYFKTAIFEAISSNKVTSGLFEPRILGALKKTGYLVSFELMDLEINDPSSMKDTSSKTTSRRLNALEKEIFYDLDHDLLLKDGPPLDFGGIGKGLALRNLSRLLKDFSGSSPHLIEAGGDIVTFVGNYPEEPWFVDIENPFSVENLPLMVRLGNNSVATSSTKIRSWRLNGTQKHHLIDPATMDSSDSDLVSVSVIGKDPAHAEVWSKSLFLLGSKKALEQAAFRKISAFMITSKKQILYSKKFAGSMEVRSKDQSSVPIAAVHDISLPYFAYSVGLAK
ncbi:MULTISPECIES: FAD:protein FMN transferase [Acidithrix]|uniref:FAD:protein FMN transferase n=1 Tax=Acidithrix ferrooxidans TaxID=1280514 RepID=A0A0D8HKP2_9ACTN|nr:MULTISPECIES: FAD:protein FMN transferase [Acidithrix]KJF18327.1 thiamine biosynthesis lipoprotein ApbE precursor [Acidithrix ferrooxidans]CAG4921231.1 unnamed protein product [Acidithrix sp. C25]